MCAETCACKHAKPQHGQPVSSSIMPAWAANVLLYHAEPVLLRPGLYLNLRLAFSQLG